MVTERIDILNKIESGKAEDKGLRLFSNDAIPGIGVIDYSGIFKELKRIQLSSVLSIEHYSNWYDNLPDVIEIRRCSSALIYEN